MTDPSAETLRIARFLARCGVASRRKAEGLVSEGRIAVNGTIARDLGRQINPATDVVTLDGEPVALPAEHLTLAFHKPRRVLVSRGDDRERRTVYDLLPDVFDHEADRLVYAGRLDYMSEGLLILSTDTELIQNLTHPTRHVAKEYLVRLNAHLGSNEFRRIRSGEIMLEDGPVRPLRLEEAGRPGEPLYRITLAEGRNRIVRRLFEAAGRRVDRLVRTRIGGLGLENEGQEPLESGDWRVLDAREIALLSDPSGK